MISKVPVSLFLTYDSRLLAVGGGQSKIVPFPVPPFQLVEASEGEGERVSLIGGGTGWVRKQEYPYVPFTPSRPGMRAAPAFDAIMWLVKCHPELVEQILGDIEPYPVFLDIETAATTVHFSRAERDPILSIQIKYPDSEPKIFLCEEDSEEAEREMIRNAIAYLRQSPSGKSPDVVVGYFLNRFDVPYIRQRCKVLGILDEYRTLSKVGNFELYPSFIISGRRSSKDELTSVAPGLLTIDLYIHARSDVLLKDLPSRTMKNVARYYGSKDVIDLDATHKTSMRDLFTHDRSLFMAYAESDIRQTEYLYHIYANRLIASANLLSCPMTMVHHMSSGQKSYLALFRECRANGFYAFKTNAERYAHLYERNQKYQGALVDCFKKGYFPRMVYVDCASMYPNIMHDFNVSYDRYRVDDVIEFKDWAVRKGVQIPDWLRDTPSNEIDWNALGFDPVIECEGPPHERVCYVPDSNYGLVLKFVFDFVNDGFMRRMIDKYNDIRREYKAKMKEAASRGDKVAALMYDSTQQEAKIINNTFYGIQGNRYYDFADLPAAIFVTAIGRWIMQQMIDIFGDAIIELDTDGVMVDRTKFDMSIDKINSILRERINKHFGVPFEKMNFLLEFEGAGSVYMYKTKNYIHRLDGTDNLKFKGSAFTGYDKAPVFHRAVQIMAKAVMFELERDPSAYHRAAAEARDILNLPRDMFKFSKTVKRDVSEYKGYQSISVFARNVKKDTPARMLSEMKQRAREWIYLKFGGEANAHKDPMAKRYLADIRRCKTESELGMVFARIDGAKGDAKPFFMLDMIMRRMSRGQDVEVDDVIEYYYTKTKEGYTLADEMTDDIAIDYDRYMRDINRIVDRFSYADPLNDNFDMMRFLGDTQKAKEEEDGDTQDYDGEDAAYNGAEDRPI